MSTSSITSSGGWEPTTSSARRPAFTTRTPYPASRRIPASRARWVGLSSTMRTSPSGIVAPPGHRRYCRATAMLYRFEEREKLVDLEILDGAGEGEAERLVEGADALGDASGALVVAAPERRLEVGQVL